MKMQAMYIQPSWDDDGPKAGLIKGEWYDVEFAIIKRSSMSVYLKGFDVLFNSALFRYQLEGNDVNIVEDARPLLLKRPLGGYLTTLIRYAEGSDEHLINIKHYIPEDAIVYRNSLSLPK